MSVTTLPAAARPATFRDHKALAETWRDTLSRTQFNWKPTPERWSVAECLQHLNRTAHYYAPALEDAVASTPLPPGAPPFRYGWLGRLTIHTMGPDTRLKIPTMSFLEPRSDGGAAASDFDPDAVVAEFGAYQDRFAKALASADGLDLGAAKMSSPTVKLWRLPIGAWFEAMAGHQARHLLQAERVTTTPSFP